jgi:hypothetical protein
MRRVVGATLLSFALCAGPAEAHRDRILHVKADGSIPDIPAEFGKVRLTLEGLGSNHPLIQLRIGTHQTTLPLCVANMIRTTSAAEIRVTGSWYHDEKNSLPYYLDIQFFEPGYDPKRSYNSSHTFLFNLHNAKLIDAGAFKPTIPEMAANARR